MTMAASEFNAFLMPTSFLRRWRYDELIPALLYFDRVTFLMDDIEAEYVVDDPNPPPGDPVRRLWSPEELKGVADDEFVDGLAAEQHRYYWPLRDLMKEEVLAISSMGLGSPLSGNERNLFVAALQEPGDPLHRIAVDYLAAAAHYFDLMNDEPPEEDDIGKAWHVYGWLQDSLRWGEARSGWQRVLLDESALTAYQKALELFPSFYELNAQNRYRSSATPSSEEALLALRVTADLLKEQLPSYTVGEDPVAISEILEVRESRRDELEAFRAGMLNAAGDLRLSELDTEGLRVALGNYLRTVRPLFETTSRALAQPWGRTRRFLRESSAIVVAALIVGVGAAVAGPAGAAVGGVASLRLSHLVEAAISESTKRISADAADAAANASTPGALLDSTSIAYLFHAGQAIAEPTTKA